MKKILESRLEFREGELHRITVLVDCTSSVSEPLTDVRAITATTIQSGGYFYLSSGIKNVSTDLLLEVAYYGCELDGRDAMFPNWKSNFKKRIL